MAEPITLAEAKSHLRVIFNDDDSYITALISAARQYAEQYQNRVYVAPDPTVTADEEMPFMEKCACLLMIGHWYENRSAVSAEKDMREIPLGVKDILNLRRNIPI